MHEQLPIVETQTPDDFSNILKRGVLKPQTGCRTRGSSLLCKRLIAIVLNAAFRTTVLVGGHGVDLHLTETEILFLPWNDHVDITPLHSTAAVGPGYPSWNGVNSGIPETQRIVA